MARMTMIEFIRGTHGNAVVVAHDPDEDPVELLKTEIPEARGAEITFVCPMEGHFAPVALSTISLAKKMARGEA